MTKRVELHLILIIVCILCCMGIFVAFQQSSYANADTIQGLQIEERSFALTSEKTVPSVESDINIMELIPSAVFQNEGDYSFIGRNYSYAANVVEEHNKLITSIILFNVISEIQENGDVIKVGIDVLYTGCFTWERTRAVKYVREETYDNRDIITLNNLAIESTLIPYDQNTRNMDKDFFALATFDSDTRESLSLSDVSANAGAVMLDLVGLVPGFSTITSFLSTCIDMANAQVDSIDVAVENNNEYYSVARTEDSVAKNIADIESNHTFVKGDKFNAYFYVNNEYHTSYANTVIKFNLGYGYNHAVSEFYLPVSNVYGREYELQVNEIKKDEDHFVENNPTFINKCVIGDSEDVYKIQVSHSQEYKIQASAFPNSVIATLTNASTEESVVLNLENPVSLCANVNYYLSIRNTSYQIFAYNLKIIPKQKMVNINESLCLESSIYSYMFLNSVSNAQFFCFNFENSNINDDINIYVCDEEMNILNSGYIFQGSIMVNYLFTPNLYYYIVIESNSQINGFLSIENERSIDDLIVGINANDIYYTFESKYTLRYILMQNAVQIYDASFVLQNHVNNSIVLQNEKYFVCIDSNIDSFSLDIDYSFAESIAVGENKSSSDMINPIYRFVPLITAEYIVDGVSWFDVYDGNVAIMHNSSEMFLEANHVYYIIADNCIEFRININTQDVCLNDIVTLNSENNVKVVKLQLLEPLRIDINGTFNDVNVYDSAYVLLNKDGHHGYNLQTGTYYVQIEFINYCELEIREYVQVVDIVLFVDGKEWYNSSNSSDVYYYDHLYSLPIPQKDGYDFAGWENEQGVTYTSSNGNSFNALLVDDLVLYAKWTIQSLTMQIMFENNAILWWNGENFVESKPAPTEIDLISQLVSLKDNYVQMDGGKKAGYYLGDNPFIITKSKNENNYIFTPNWQVEKYLVTFVYNTDNIPPAQNANKVVAFEERITGDIFEIDFLLETEGYIFNGWSLSVDLSNVFNFDVGGYIGDLTPGYGSIPNFDSDNDNILDSTNVILFASYTKKQYRININGVPTTVEHGGNYTFLAPNKYNYSTSDYYKYNISYRYSDNQGSIVKTVNATLENITHNMDFILIQNDVNVVLNYSESTANKKQMLLHEEYTFEYEPAFDRSYDVSWGINGSYVNKLNFYNLKEPSTDWYSSSSPVTLYRNISVIRTRSSITPSNYSTININNSTVGVYCDSSSAKHNITFNISSDVEKITFEGNGKKWRDTRIVVESRSTPLYMSFSNIEFMAPASKSVLNASNCPNLFLYSYNTAILRAGEATLQNPESGAILCRSMALEGEEFQIYGGDAWIDLSGGNKNGTAGIYCPAGDSVIEIYCNITIIGGYGAAGRNGTKGTDGSSTGASGSNGTNGQDGGNGAYGIYTLGSISIKLSASGIIKGGTGGNGGKGGDGGAGADGRSGRFGVTTINPGNGGTGGKGGNGGNGRKGTNCIIYNQGNVQISSGEYGLGGDGGTGGNPGSPVYTYPFKNERRGQSGGSLGRGNNGGVN